MEDSTEPPNPPNSPFKEGAIERMVGILGRRLFEFVVNSTVESIADGAANREALTVAQEIDDFLDTTYEGESNPKAWGEVLKGNLTDPSQSGGPLALRLRVRSGASNKLPEGVDEIEKLLVGIAQRVYPTFLLPLDTQFPELPDFLSRPRIFGTLHRDPANEAFQEKVLADPIFAKVYTQKTKESGHVGMVYCSTGRGGSVQLWTLAEQILQAAWAAIPDATMTEFVEEALRQYRFAKNAYSGKEQMVKSRISFAGVLIPSDKAYSFGGVELRAATQADHDKAPQSLVGQLSTTHENNEQVLINYSGDVIAEVDVPYLVKVSKEGLGAAPSAFPQELLDRNPLNNISIRLRTALLLALDRPYRVQAVESWRSTNDPLNHGPSMSWSNRENFLGILAATLTDEDMVAWEAWYKLLSTPGAERIQLAISRVVRASAERRDPVDVLIDSVIAWENLFGTKDGEPTLRVTASLALLLESDPMKRRKFRTKLGKMYALRSDAVHGTAMPKPSEMSLCFEALDVAIRALRVILKDRADLLTEGDGGVRSLKLILGESDVPRDST
jgi:hypothetical protein